VGLDDLGVGVEVDLDDVVGDQLGAEPLGLLAEIVQSGNPGKFSTSVVFIRAPPAVTDPSKTSGSSSARAE
jgi:hypothetical protein